MPYDEINIPSVIEMDFTGLIAAITNHNSILMTDQIKGPPELYEECIK